MGVLSLFVLTVLVAFCVHTTSGCDIIVHVKSDTAKKFSAQVTAPNGKKSEKWNFSRKREKNTFKQNPDECGIKDWEITTFENGKEAHNVKVKLDGIGRVTYFVGDDLIPKQHDRQGAQCTGECAPLA
ncbi:hypothetical protein AB6A40_000778 [Gnathostoma spinigerum]|uniref:Uncharacterized protein n=1 Tax=Gnathostoma spinigerum TaxID=75299 RepID=A0ABD6E2R1_9BILA